MKTLKFNEYFKLNEIYKEEIVKNADSVRKSNAQGVVVEFVKFHFRKKYIEFRVMDPRGSGKWWQVFIQIQNIAQISRDKKMPASEKIQLAIDAGDIKVSCKCPDFLYGGYKYIAHVAEFGIEKEEREPVFKNPKTKGTVCKHILGALQDIDNHIDAIEKSYKEEAKNKYKKKTI